MPPMRDLLTGALPIVDCVILSCPQSLETIEPDAMHLVCMNGMHGVPDALHLVCTKRQECTKARMQCIWYAENGMCPCLHNTVFGRMRDECGRMKISGDRADWMMAGGLLA
jgi:hypothetical protein